MVQVTFVRRSAPLRLIRGLGDGLTTTRSTPKTSRSVRMSVRRSLAVVIAVAAAALAVAGVKAESAYACSTYWTVGCQYYTHGEGHTARNQNGNNFEYVYTTFDTNQYVKTIWTTAGGSWIASQVVASGGAVYYYLPASNDYFGCYNHNTPTMWVNCRAADNY